MKHLFLFALVIVFGGVLFSAKAATNCAMCPPDMVAARQHLRALEHREEKLHMMHLQTLMHFDEVSRLLDDKREERAHYQSLWDGTCHTRGDRLVYGSRCRRMHLQIESLDSRIARAVHMLEGLKEDEVEHGLRIEDLQEEIARFRTQVTECKEMCWED